MLNNNKNSRMIINGAWKDNSRFSRKLIIKLLIKQKNM